METFVTRRLRIFAFALLAATPAPAAAQRLGLFFDAQATQCATSIPTFGSAHTWIFAFPPPDSLISGVAFKLLLPAQMAVAQGSLVLPREPRVASTEGDLLTGMTIRYDACMSGVSPLLVAEMDIDDRAFVARNDLRVTLVGVGVDSIASQYPQLIICDPGDPLGGERGRIPSPSVDAVFNCTAHCGCTTALRPRSWSEMKFLYREH